MRRKNRGSENDRPERINTAGSHGDNQAGDEGLDDPSMSRSNRDDMSATPVQGDRMGEGRSNREESQRSRRTKSRANDERHDEASEFRGQGAQKEGATDDAEGTGYTRS